MRIYLDINGVVEYGGEIAPGVKEFLKAVAGEHELYWLTTHCNGDVAPTQKYLRSITKDDELQEVFKKVLPTEWALAKPEGLDYTDDDMVWYDDKPLSANEEDYLRARNALHVYKQVDLTAYPDFWERERASFTASDMGERVIAFLQGVGTTASGKTIQDVWSFDNEELENTHDYIQWLFPLVEQSEMVPGSPFIDPKDIARIREDELIQENMVQSLARMQQFYDEYDGWLVAGDHNHYRISRIIRSVKLLNSQENAEEFYQEILRRVEEKMPVTFESLNYWKEGLEGK